MRAAIVVLLLLTAAGCACRGRVPMAAEACRVDADCVPATCCHPTACVLRADAPDCERVACTRECAPGTMDCGGACECRAGRCAARLARP